MTATFAREAAAAAMADAVTHPFLETLGLGRSGHGGKPGPVAEAFARFVATFAEKAERKAARPEVRRRLMTCLVPHWEADELKNLRHLHERATARSLRFMRGAVEIHFTEDDFVDLVGTLLFEVKIEEKHHEKTTGQGNERTHHEETTRTRVVKPWGKDELGMGFEEFLAKLESLAGKPDAFFQLLYGLRDDGWKQAANDLGDGVVAALEELGEIRLFGSFGPRIIRGTKPRTAAAAPLALQQAPSADDVDEALPPQPPKKFFERTGAYVARIQPWIFAYGEIRRRNEERQRLREARTRAQGGTP